MLEGQGMAPRWFCSLVAALLTAAPAGAQLPTTVDAAWIAAMLPILRPFVSTATIVAVGADTSDHRSLALATALAAERAVPGPGAPVLRPGSGGSECASLIAPADSASARPRGDLVWVRWSWRAPADSSHGILEVTFSCRHRSGRPFGQGVEQRVERGPDGQWRAVGRPGGWTS